MSKIRTEKWHAAVKQMQQVATTKTAEEIGTDAVRGFIKEVVNLTPPANGSADSAAKKKGEQSILADLLRIAQPAVAVGRGGTRALATSAQLLAQHAASRNHSTGGVKPLQEKLLVSQAAFNSTLTTLQKLVGILAAGWNFAAAKFGAKLPAWVRRHGDKYGVVIITASGGKMRIVLGNKVPFADNVKNLQRRAEAALKYQTNKLNRGAQKAIARLARKAGFKN